MCAHEHAQSTFVYYTFYKIKAIMRVGTKSATPALLGPRMTTSSDARLLIGLVGSTFNNIPKLSWPTCRQKLLSVYPGEPLGHEFNTSFQCMCLDAGSKALCWACTTWTSPPARGRQHAERLRSCRTRTLSLSRSCLL